MILFRDLDWPINASRKFVSDSWASCLLSKINDDCCRYINISLSGNPKAFRTRPKTGNWRKTKITKPQFMNMITTRRRKWHIVSSTTYSHDLSEQRWRSINSNVIWKPFFRNSLMCANEKNRVFREKADRPTVISWCMEITGKFYFKQMAPTERGALVVIRNSVSQKDGVVGRFRNFDNFLCVIGLSSYCNLRFVLNIVWC